MGRRWIRGLLVAATVVLLGLKVADQVTVSWIAVLAPALVAAVTTGSG